MDAPRRQEYVSSPMRALFVSLLAFGLTFSAYAEGVQPARLTEEDMATLARVEKYLSGIRTISAEFIQQSPNGDVATGKFYLDRPGKLRMEYNPPMPVLMVTSGRDLVYYDKELDQVSHIPLESTLVSFLARDEVKFDETVTVTDIIRGERSLRLSLVQRRRPRDGMLTLEFSDRPLIIRSMIVKDSAGQVTTVSLNNARFDAPLEKSLFVFHDPHLGARHSGLVK